MPDEQRATGDTGPEDMLFGDGGVEREQMAELILRESVTPQGPAQAVMVSGGELVFDAGKQVLTLYDEGGNVVEAWPARSGIPEIYEPITPGTYFIDPEMVSDVSWWKPGAWRNPRGVLGRDRDAWGPQRVSLLPTPRQQDRIEAADRRGGFFLHGGTYPGTAGCVEMSNADVNRALGMIKQIGRPVRFTVVEPGTS